MMADAICVCDRYADMLALTLPHNRGLFRRFVVVTSEGDEATKEVAKQHGAEIVVSGGFQLPGRVLHGHRDRSRSYWNKAAAINDGYRAIADDAGWVCILDADTFVPPTFSRIRLGELGHDAMYGCRRCDLTTPEQMSEYLANPEAFARKAEPLPSVPGVGYFQLFHRSSQESDRIYNDQWGYAGQCDDEFRRQFPRVHELPFMVGHIHHGPPRINWRGRMSPPVWEAVPQRNDRLVVDAVTVCNGYADMLAITMPYNRERFRRWVVVGGPDDDRVRSLCDQYGAEFVVCDRFGAGGDVPGHHAQDRPPWNKGCAVNDGIDALHSSGWVLILDADILVPPAFDRIRHHTRLLRDRLYGCHRVDINNHDELAYFKRDPSEAGMTLNRIKSRVGIGFFQLFNMRAKGLAGGQCYPEKWAYAGTSDVKFLQKFPPPKRLGFRVGHLYHGQHQANWFGRTTQTVWGDAWA